MGKAERAKGARGEREIVNLLKARGIDAQRTAPLQSAVGAKDADVLALPGAHLEVKRQERVQIEAWCKQAEAVCGSDLPLVVWRRSGQPWRVTLPLDGFLDLYGIERL